jgi:hypothetical protein
MRAFAEFVFSLACFSSFVLFLGLLFLIAA